MIFVLMSLPLESLPQLVVAEVIAPLNPTATIVARIKDNVNIFCFIFIPTPKIR